MRIGVTGYVQLAPVTAAQAYELIADELRRHAGTQLHGVTCLAHGADQLFGKAITALQGTLEVVLPARDYREQIVASGDPVMFDELIGQASAVHLMPFPESNRNAYRAASAELLNRCDWLLAVWDGSGSARPGDTADVVSMAHERGMPVVVIWPPDSRRH